jgi:hypothetical protein
VRKKAGRESTPGPFAEGNQGGEEIPRDDNLYLDADFFRDGV